MSKKKAVSNPQAIILDIDGTTTDRHFFTQTVTPLIKSSFANFLNQTYDSSDVIDLIRKLRTKAKSGDVSKMPKIVIGSREQVISSVVDNIRWQIRNKIKTSELKKIELLWWMWAYDNELFEFHIYDDVSPNLHIWKTKFGIKIYTLSGAMSLAQQLLFAKTTHGNVHSLIDGFFDSSLGSKTNPETYKLISDRIGVEVSKILFITDDPKEAKSAIRAGLLSLVIKRPENERTDQYPDIPRIESFGELKF